MSNRLWLIWKEPKERRRFIIGELVYEDNEYKFRYIDPELNSARDAGLDFFPGFGDIEMEYRSVDLFPNIDTRLPNIARPEYLKILNLYDLTTDSSKMEILEKTRGRLLTDNFEFVPVFDRNKIEFEVAGTSHSEDIKKYKNILEINDDLILERQLDNEYDEHAVKVMCKKNNNVYCLGYVPRYYSKELSQMISENVQYSARIKFLNFESKLNDEDITVDVKIIFDCN